MGLLAMLLACCTAASPGTSAPAPGVDTVAVYAQVVAAIRAGEPRGITGRIFLADERFRFPRYTGERHSPGLLRELLSRGIVDGVYDYERRSPTDPCVDCTRIVLGPVTEHERTLHVDPNDLSDEVEPAKGIPVKHWVDVDLARTCRPESVRAGTCTAESVGAACRGGEEHSRRYYFTREPEGGLRLVACAVSRVI